MPRYELMYILASSVSDDQVPAVSGGVEQFVSDFGGTDIQHNQLGKKKLAYPIKKTRNGNYGVIDFTMESTKVNGLDAKLRTQTSTIIRHLIVNIDEHLERLAKDREVQAKMNRNRPPESIPSDESAPAVKSEKKPVEDANIDDEIEKALTEDITI